MLSEPHPVLFICRTDAYIYILVFFLIFVCIIYAYIYIFIIIYIYMMITIYHNIALIANSYAFLSPVDCAASATSRSESPARSQLQLTAKTGKGRSKAPRGPVEDCDDRFWDHRIG